MANNLTPEKKTNSTTQKEKIQYGTTQGRKGHKMPRINLAFSTENHDFLRMESRKRGMTITGFINHILDQFRSENK